MNKEIDSHNGFCERVYSLVSEIPRGRIMTYGDIAGMCGSAHASRIVGGIAHFGPDDLPWHRVVNRFGGLASGYPGGREQQKQILMSEGIEVSRDFTISNFEALRWNPYSENTK